jgi:hypothetical protein
MAMNDDDGREKYFREYANELEVPRHLREKLGVPDVAGSSWWKRPHAKHGAFTTWVLMGQWGRVLPGK